MQSFKRNQAAEAISGAVGQGAVPSTALRTEMKRLLDTDRSVDVILRSNDPEHANYAFYSGESPGRGTEVWFSEYEIFALRLGLDLMEHGWPQATVISILRRARRDLEPMHAQILQWNPTDLFDEKKILEAAKPGALAVSTTRPVHLVISSRKGRPIQQSSDKTREIAVLEEDKLMPFILREVGISHTMIELTRMAHNLHKTLMTTKPSKRGRGNS
jgi:hypothetical protein